MSDNLKSPAYPVHIEPGDTYSGHAFFDGFTKLEKAALMIAQGYVANGVFNGDEQEDYELSKRAVKIAKAVLEEANK
jgi:hypothetical protein